MTAKTKYSRSTWKKNQLRANMNTPKLGNRGCSLCYDRSIPSNLNAHVSESQTCADVHLQLSLLRYDNAMCAVGQAQYQEICCPSTKSEGKLKDSLMVMGGVLLIGLIFKKIISGRSCRRPEHGNSKSDKHSKSLPMNHHSSSGSTSSGSSKRSKGSSSEMEMPTSAYQNMDNMTMNTMSTGGSGKITAHTRASSRSGGNISTNTISTSRSHGRSRPPENRSRSHGRPQSRVRERPQSRPRERSQSRSRAILAESSSSSNDVRRTASRSRPQSRSREMSRALSSRPRSRSRSKSRDRRRMPSQQQHCSQRGHSQPPMAYVTSYNPNPYRRHEEVEVSSDAGPILPTQLV